jgi:hypothetical protein
MHSTEKLDDGYLGSGKVLKRSIKKHGRLNHVIARLEFFTERSLLKVREKEIINEDLIKNPLCMNIKLGGEGGGVKGVTRTIETKMKMSASWRIYPRVIDPEKLRIAQLGKKHSEKTKQKMSALRLGKKLPPLSEDHKSKLSEARRKRIISQETKDKTSKTNKERNVRPPKLTEEWRRLQIDAVSQALLGKKHPRITCPHCDKIGGRSAMKQHHFDNCKEIAHE